jgi:hypothetical protein
MKLMAAALFLAIGVIGGCSLWGPERISTSGEHPALGRAQPMTPEALEAQTDTGRLLVYTPRTGVTNEGPYTGYSVFSESGLKVAHETNQLGLRAEGPVELKLAPGRYFVRLDEPGQGLREFWVRVERAKVTRIEHPSGAAVELR